MICDSRSSLPGAGIVDGIDLARLQRSLACGIA
jgi:hypothetical protein